MLMFGAFRKVCPGRAAWLLGLAVFAASAVVAAADAPAPADRAAATVDAPVAAQPQPPHAPRSAAGKPTVETAKSLPEDDYYSKRAKSLLVEDAADAAKQVSLQAAYPGHNVVMCEAGCYGGSKRLVQFSPIVLTNAASSRSMDPASAKLAAAQGNDVVAAESVVMAGTEVATPPLTDEITCVAGCYGANRSYKAASRAVALAATRAEVEAKIRSHAAAGMVEQPPASVQPPRGATGAAASRWMTTSAKAEGDNRASPRAAASPANPAKLKKRTMSAKAGRRASSPSGEWFQRINSDRTSSY